MGILATLISILGITAVTRSFNRVSSFKICPICAGVSVTWAWMLAVWFLGYGGTGQIADPLLIAILMGGSIVGIAYKADKFVPEKWDLIWKTSFIPVGFIAQYMLLTRQMGYFAAFLALLLLIAWFFIWNKKEIKDKSSRSEEIKKGLEKCC